MSISLLVMALPRGLVFVGGRQASASGVLPLDAVLQDTDLLDLELDRIAMLEKPSELEAAAIADRAGADEFAGHQRLVLADVGDDLLEGEQHALAHAFRAGLAVDARFHLQIVGIADLVWCHDPRTHHVAAVKTLALG